MTQQYVPPQRPSRPASRLVAGVLWLGAAVTAVVATFSNLVIYSFTDREAIFVVGFWRQYGLTRAGEELPGNIYYGAAEVGAAALLVLATLLVFLSARRSAALVAGAFGTGMLVTSTLTWFLTALTKQVNNTTSIEVGLWVLAAATAVAVLAFLVSLAGRTQPAEQQQHQRQQPSYAPSQVPAAPQPSFPPSPAPQPQWEHETPKYGIAVQQEEPPAPKRDEELVPVPERAAVSKEEDLFLEAFDLPEFTANGSRPGHARRLDGDDK